MDWIGLAAALLRFGMLAIMVWFLWTLLRAVRADLNLSKAGPVLSLREGVSQAPAILEVVVSTGGDLYPGQVIPLTGEIKLGRGEGNDLLIEDNFASHQHARVWIEHGAYLVEDLASTNGTFLNGCKVMEPTIIKHGDLIKVGGATFRLAVRSFAN